jgi:hypothetical protein
VIRNSRIPLFESRFSFCDLRFETLKQGSPGLFRKSAAFPQLLTFYCRFSIAEVRLNSSKIAHRQSSRGEPRTYKTGRATLPLVYQIPAPPRLSRVSGFKMTTGKRLFPPPKGDHMPGNRPVGEFFDSLFLLYGISLLLYSFMLVLYAISLLLVVFCSLFVAY